MVINTAVYLKEGHPVANIVCMFINEVTQIFIFSLARGFHSLVLLFQQTLVKRAINDIPFEAIGKTDTQDSSGLYAVVDHNADGHIFDSVTGAERPGTPWEMRLNVHIYRKPSLNVAD